MVICGVYWSLWYYGGHIAHKGPLVGQSGASNGSLGPRVSHLGLLVGWQETLVGHRGPIVGQ